MKITKTIFLIFCALYLVILVRSKSNVEATIFDLPVSTIEKMPAYLFRDNLSSNPYKVTFNGNTTYMTVSKVKDNISNILDFYEKQYPPKNLLKVKEHIMNEIKKQKALNNKKFIDVLNYINSYINPLITNPHFRWENDSLGVLGIFEFSESIFDMDFNNFVKNYKQAVETGAFGKIGKARAVIVIKNNDISKILNLWTTSDFNINNITGKYLNTFPDYLEIRSHPKSKVLLSMEQENSQTIDRITMCEWNLPLDNIIDFYNSNMSINNWKAQSDFNRLNKKLKVNLQYKRNNRTIIIWIEKNKKNKSFICTLIDREKKQL